uniref:BLUF domain-containing protein n=1 Tax=Leptobrachium leishanense TaxID=445787 RepID=A0A8C5R5Z2_9ANUR
MMENWGKSKDSDWNSEFNLEKGGTSYYHQLLNKRMVLNARDDTKSLLHRLIFVSKLSPELADKRDLAGYWEHQFHQGNQGETVTGLLLLYPSYTVHVLESSSEVLYWVFRELKNMKRQGSRALVLEPRILVMSHNIPNRLFSQFSYKVLDVPTRHLEEKYSDEATDGIITECLTKILNIGMHLAKYPKGSKNIPDAVFEKISELTIPQGFISHLLQCKEFLTPEQFLEIYDGPMNILLDSGHIFGSVNQDKV